VAYLSAAALVVSRSVESRPSSLSALEVRHRARRVRGERRLVDQLLDVRAEADLPHIGSVRPGLEAEGVAVGQVVGRDARLVARGRATAVDGATARAREVRLAGAVATGVGADAALALVDVGDDLRLGARVAGGRVALAQREGPAFARRERDRGGEEGTGDDGDRDDATAQVRLHGFSLGS
jgi:hypothetical protein